MKVCLLTLDDVGFDLLDRADTPEIDALRIAGLEFTRFVAAPNCSNFRAKLETGLYSPRPRNQTGGIFNKQVTSSLPAHDYSLGNCADATSHIGKWHCSQVDDYTHRAHHGYDHYAGSQANLNPGSYWNWVTTEQGFPYWTQDYATDYVSAVAQERIAAGDDFVNVSFNAAHKPYGPANAPPGFSEGTAENILSYADGAVGRVAASALERGYGVILTSDNGGTAQDGGKGNLSVTALHTLLVLVGDWPAMRGLDKVVDATDLHATVWWAVAGLIGGVTDGLPLHDGFRRDVAFADRFKAVGAPPGDDWLEMATDGAVKVIRQPSARSVMPPTTWDDAPTMQSADHLIAALDGRLN